MLESKAYKTYYAFAYGEKTLKPKYIRKKADFDTSPKQKPVQATKGTRLNTKDKVAKSDKKKQPAKMPKAKGLDVLSKVALTKVEQLKLTTKKSKTQIHISQASGLGDGTDFELGVPDEQHLKTTGADEGTGTILGVLDVPKYESKSEKESWGDGGEEDENKSVDKSDGNDDDGGGSDDHDKDSDDEWMKADRDEILDPNLTNVDQTEHEEEDADERVHTPSDYELTDDEKIYNQEYINDEQRMDDEEEDKKANELVQSSYVSSDFTRKLLNLKNPSPADNEIAFLMDTTTRHAIVVLEITSSFTTTIPLPLRSLILFYKLQPYLLLFWIFLSVLRFNDKVTNLEKDLSEIKQVDHKEAQAEKQEYIDNIDSTVRTIIREEVKTQLPKILPKAVLAFATPVIERNVTKLLEAAVLTRSSSQPKSTYEAAASLFEFELTKILLDKMEQNKSHLRADHKKKLYDALVESYNTNKDLFNTYEFNTCNNDEQPADKEVTKADWFKKPERPPTPNSDWNKRQHVDFQPPKRIIVVTRLMIMKKYDYCNLEEIEVRREDQKLYKFKEAKGIRMEYMPKRKWSGLDKLRAPVMIKDIDKQLYERRLMWNLKKFIGGREYENDLKMLERTI
nr:hypothetical protein [Tanacetum cinerariifolium]